MSPLMKVQRVLDVFRSHDEIMPSQRIEAFLLVAMRKRMTTEQIAEDLGIHLSAARRNLAALGEHPYRINLQEWQGLGWLKCAPDPNEPRRMSWTLTTQGKRIVEQIETIIGGGR